LNGTAASSTVWAARSLAFVLLATPYACHTESTPDHAPPSVTHVILLSQPTASLPANSLAAVCGILCASCPMHSLLPLTCMCCLSTACLSLSDPCICCLPAALPCSQIEAHPFWPNTDLIQWAQSMNMHVTAYR
jgi:hypothetical protein